MLFVSGYVNKINLVETELLKDKFLLLSFTLKHAIVILLISFQKYNLLEL